MANTRFVTINQAATLGIIKNGTGGGAPALNETSGFPMNNALVLDRYTIWKSASAPPGNSYFDLDLQANRSIGAACVHGFRVSNLTALFINVYYSTAANGYPPTAGSSWTSAASMNVVTVPRDAGNAFASAILARYWRFEFVVSGSGFFSAGKILLGAVTDLGRVFSPGTQETIVRYRTEAATPAGQLVLNDFGDTGRLWSLNFDSITSSTLTTLQGLTSQTGSFTYIDENGVFYEVVLQGGQVAFTRRFNDLYAGRVELKRLP